jgi:hypothetical protein
VLKIECRSLYTISTDDEAEENLALMDARVQLYAVGKNVSQPKRTDMSAITTATAAESY